MKKHRKHYTPEDKVAVHWLHHAKGHAGRLAAGDPRGTRPKVGGGQATAKSPPASRVQNRKLREVQKEPGCGTLLLQCNPALRRHLCAAYYV
jgi:hypothetical protein